jgi:hypothetical protein
MTYPIFSSSSSSEEYNTQGIRGCRVEKKEEGREEKRVDRREILCLVFFFYSSSLSLLFSLSEYVLC